MTGPRPPATHAVKDERIVALTASVARLREALEEAEEFLTSEASVTDRQRIANATVTIRHALNPLSKAGGQA